MSCCVLAQALLFPHWVQVGGDLNGSRAEDISRDSNSVNAYKMFP